LLRSDECARNVIEAVMRGRELPHAAVEVGPVADVTARLCSALNWSAGARERLLAAVTWPALLAALFESEECVELFLSVPQASPWFVRCLQLKRVAELLRGPRSEPQLRWAAPDGPESLTVEFVLPPRSEVPLRVAVLGQEQDARELLVGPGAEGERRFAVPIHVVFCVIKWSKIQFFYF
jgi:hypothetical protein